MDDELHACFLGNTVSKLDHLFELPGRIDVDERKRGNTRIEGFASQVEHNRTVFPNAVEHAGLFCFGNDLTHNVNRFGFKGL